MIQLVFLLQSGFIAEGGLIVKISFFFSLFSIITKATKEDKRFFKIFNFSFSKKKLLKCKIKECVNWYYILNISHRFLEISGRIIFLSLFWIIVGGLAAFIVLIIDILIISISIYTAYCDDQSIPLDLYTYLVYTLFIPRYMTKSAQSRRFNLFCYRIIINVILLIVLTIFVEINFNSSESPDYKRRHDLIYKSKFTLFLYIFVWIW